MEKIKLAIVDDHKIFRKGVRLCLEKHATSEIMEFIFEAENGADLLKYLEAGYIPHIILMDIAMPVMNGVEATHEVKKKYKNIKVIALTMYEYSSIIEESPNIELDGYLAKSYPPETLVSAIKIVHEGGVFFPSNKRQGYLF